MPSPPIRIAPPAILNSPSSREIRVNEISAIPAWFVLTRAIHFAAALLIFSVCVFDRMIALPAISKKWNRIAAGLMFVAMPAALLSGIAWLAAVAIQMSEQSPSMEIVRTVLSHTQFGMIWQLRLAVWITLLIFLSLRWKWMPLIFSGVFLLTLAWSGHGQTGRLPRLHLLADILHLLAAGVWPTSLLPLAILLWQMRKTSQQWIGALVRRFSAMSVIAVALLLISGMANSCCLIAHFGDLFLTTYGRVLLVKIVLSLLMVAIGGVNLLIFAPRLPRSAARLRWNVLAELLLSTAVLIIVAILGLLPPTLQ
jgi:putative copper resistance protein D